MILLRQRQKMCRVLLVEVLVSAFNALNPHLLQITRLSVLDCSFIDRVALFLCGFRCETGG